MASGNLDGLHAQTLAGRTARPFRAESAVLDADDVTAGDFRPALQGISFGGNFLKWEANARGHCPAGYFRRTVVKEKMQSRGIILAGIVARPTRAKHRRLGTQLLQETAVRQSAITWQAHEAASAAKEEQGAGHGVASHLGIKLEEYDARIRTFIPDYEEMLAAAAGAISRRARRIVDLGTGTGALAERCLRQAPRARVLGIDADGEILKLAERRLGRRARLQRGNFTGVSLPACDVVAASFALHHIRTRSDKARLYRRIRSALRPQGIFISVDCQPAVNSALARNQNEQWKAHLLSSYTPIQAAALLAAWAHEDTYVPLETELELLRRSRLKPEVLWRKGAFAVILALR